MNHISKKLTNYILLKGVIEENDFEIYQYGFQRFLELSINIMCSIIIAILLNMKLECIVFFPLFYPLTLLFRRFPHGTLFILSFFILPILNQHPMYCKVFFSNIASVVRFILHFLSGNQNNRIREPP